MTTQPTPPTEAALAESRADLYEKQHASSTVTAYNRAWHVFVDWCAATGRAGLPASEDTLITYVAALNIEGKAVSTVRQRLAAIRYHHRKEGHRYAGADSEPLEAAIKGYIRTHGVAARRQARAMHLPDLRRIVGEIDKGVPPTTAGTRDRAIILVGFAGGFRRAELVAVEIRDLEPDDRGLRIHIRSSKSDQAAVGYRKVIPFGENPETCPVVALRAWRERSGVRAGRVFRAVNKADNVWGEALSPAAVAAIIRKRALLAGMQLDPDLMQSWSGHSLRRGFATEAVEAGAPAHKIREQGGWKGPVPQAYFDAGEAWDDPAAGRLGL